MFTKSSKAIIYGRHLDVAERMLDFDFLSDRGPSVAGFIDPSIHRTGWTKLFFWEKEILFPIYPSIAQIPDDTHIDTFINLASFRSSTEATWQALRSEKFAHIVIIAEGIPEREIREIIAYNNRTIVESWKLKVESLKTIELENLKTWKLENRILDTSNLIPVTWNLQRKTLILGPATAGAIVGGTLRMGNAWGSLENIVESRLYEQGSVGFVSKSGGMSNEMYRVISKRTDGIHTGIALGGDRFTGSVFADVILEYESNPEIRMIVILGEVGGRDELEVAELIQSGKIRKPVVAYVSGSFAESLNTEVQFGHAGAKANTKEESASYKNMALRNAWAHVPESYSDFGDLIASVFTTFIGSIDPSHFNNEEIIKKVSLLKHRHHTTFTSTISDERGDDVLYNKKPLTHYIKEWSIANVIGNLWLKRDLPDYALDFTNTVIILLADHGPAVSGATNTIITARAGKDILSSLVSWLMTIGPRFGGAIDGAAREFYYAVKTHESPVDFVSRMKQSGQPIPGIGHKVKSKFHPDGRCTLLREKVTSYKLQVTSSLEKSSTFNLQPSTYYWTHLSYALEVESITLEKKSNLILNVDGHIAAIFLDIFVSIGMGEEEIEMYIDAGLFNAFFILARSIGFIGHALDQKRLGEPLYRTNWDDIHLSE